MRSRFEAMKASYTIIPPNPTNYSFITSLLIPHHMNMVATRKAIIKAHELRMCLGATLRFVLDVVAALAVPVGGSPLKGEAEFAEPPSALTTT